jgi:hypothetical protein
MFDVKSLMIFIVWAVSVTVLFFLFVYDIVGYNILYLMSLLWIIGVILGFSFSNIVWFSIILLVIITFLDLTTVYHESFAILSDYLKNSCLDFFQEGSITFNICSLFLTSGPAIYVAPLVGWSVRKLGDILPKILGYFIGIFRK